MPISNRLIERGLSAFEEHVTRPIGIKWAARLLRRFVYGGGLAGNTIKNIQRIRLERAVRHAYAHSAFYRGLFLHESLGPEAVCTPEDLRKLPFTTSDDVRNAQEFLCVPEERLSRVFATSGSTGEPKRIYYTQRDMQILTNLAALGLRIGHPGRLVALSAMPSEHGLWLGQAISELAVERAGGLPIPVGAGDPSDTMAWMRIFHPNVVITSPSYMAHLTREAERQDYRVELEKAVLGGEALTEDRAQYIKDYWNVEIYDSYGTTEIGGAQTIKLPECDVLHINDLHLVTEIVDPKTGEPADEGELVFSTLRREAMPLLRYRSGDRARWKKCGCPLPFPGFEWLGRLDDRIIVSDRSMYAQVIADAVGSVPGASGRVEIVLDRVDLVDRMRLRVEGESAYEKDVRGALFSTYPKLEGEVENGNIFLEIETGVDLSGQIKSLKLVDNRGTA
jgi:phenylacetate-CoA ligase